MLPLIVGRMSSTVGKLLHIAPTTFKATPPYLNATLIIPVSLLRPSLPRAMPGAEGMEIPNGQAGAFQGHQNANMA